MKQKGSRLLRFSLRAFALCLAALLPGCQSPTDWSLTSKLWNSESFHDFKMPSPEPRLQLFADEPNSDVLVIYDELRENDHSIRRRAFFVNQNLDLIRAGRKPRFVGLGSSRGLKPIPVLRADSGEPIPPAGLAVVRTERPHEFVIYSDKRELGAVGLPAYGSEGGFKKTLLTPLAVTGDALIVGTVVGLYAASAYAHTCH